MARILEIVGQTHTHEGFSPTISLAEYCNNRRMASKLAYGIDQYYTEPWF